MPSNTFCIALMKRLVKKLIYLLLRNAIDPLFPKRKKVILFASTGVADSNLFCILYYIRYFYSGTHVEIIKGKQRYSLSEYLSILLSFLTSYYLVVDHAIPQFITNRRRRIFNVWHGIPLKKIRHLDKKRFSEKFLDFESQNLDGLICSSELDRAVMSSCFNVKPSICVLSGMPRADLLTGVTPDWFIDEQEADLIHTLNGRRLVSWMPTYRGTWSEYNRIDGFSKIDEEEMADLLERYNAVLGVRPHKFSTIQDFAILQKRGLFVDLSPYNVTNIVLKHTHHLITDYSSVWLDYLLKSNSISLYLFDEKDYQLERGTIYPIGDIFPGTISRSFSELLRDLDRSMGEGSSSRAVGGLFFKYKDQRNTERFVQALFNG